MKLKRNLLLAGLFASAHYDMDTMEYKDESTLECYKGGKGSASTVATPIAEPAVQGASFVAGEKGDDEEDDTSKNRKKAGKNSLVVEKIVTDSTPSTTKSTTGSGLSVGA